MEREAGPDAGPREAGTQLSAVLERITYANEETGYTIARVATDRTGADLLTVVGPLLGAQVGESLRLHGRWTSHPRYGRQFEVWSYTTVLPATVQGIRRYLGSGLIKGIGPKMAERIVDHFGTDTLEVIEQQPERLVEVPGLGPKRTKMIAAAWEEQKIIKEVMIFLQGVGVSTSIAVRIFKQYGEGSIDIVRTQPYKLADDVWGIGFKTADTIAQAVGIPPTTAQNASRPGCATPCRRPPTTATATCPPPNLVADAVKILDVPPDPVTTCLETLVAEEGVVREEVPAGDNHVPAVYLPPFHRAETSLAGGLLSLLHNSHDRLKSFADVDWERAERWLHGQTGADLAAEQRQAVRLALTHKVSVLTGGPGCGKSFTVRSIVLLARARRAKVILAAPTGRAAKRLAELTGHEATTVHRLLQLRPGGDATFDRDNPLDSDLIVVDEASMLDLLLANKLVKAVAPGAHLLFVGDVDQLPSVGAGEVLKDLLAAPRHPPGTTDADLPPGPGVRRRRQRPPRQHRPPPRPGGHEGLLPVPLRGAGGDRRAHRRRRRPPHPAPLPPRPPAATYRSWPPMHRGAAGAGALNTALQEALTPRPRRHARAPLRRARLPRRRQGHPAAQQLRQGRGRGVQRHGRHRHRHPPRRAQAHRPDRRGRAGRLRLRRARRAGPRLRGVHPPLPGQRIPGRGGPAGHQRLDDAAAQPPLHRDHPRQEARRHRRLAPGAGPGRTHQGCRTPPHRPDPPPGPHK
ncbi:ATP-dependent RecD-like DNA helicase [Nonomuraea salmonea]